MFCSMAISPVCFVRLLVLRWRSPLKWLLEPILRTISRFVTSVQDSWDRLVNIWIGGPGGSSLELSNHQFWNILSKNFHLSFISFVLGPCGFFFKNNEKSKFYGKGKSHYSEKIHTQRKYTWFELGVPWCHLFMRIIWRHW